MPCIESSVLSTFDKVTLVHREMSTMIDSHKYSMFNFFPKSEV